MTTWERHIELYGKKYTPTVKSIRSLVCLIKHINIINAEKVSIDHIKNIKKWHETTSRG
jgi:hypothetical protein